MPTLTLHDNDDRADILENDNHLEKIEDVDERLSTIYESPSPQPRIEDEEEDEIYDDAYDKLIVYDIAKTESIEKVNRYYSRENKISNFFLSAINQQTTFQINYILSLYFNFFIISFSNFRSNSNSFLLYRCFL
jgi:hypothetical protein